jgi:hypothetical protein
MEQLPAPCFSGHTLTLPFSYPSQQAFWCLVQICDKYLPGYYSAGLVSEWKGAWDFFPKAAGWSLRARTWSFRPCLDFSPLR